MIVAPRLDQKRALWLRRVGAITCCCCGSGWNVFIPTEGAVWKTFEIVLRGKTWEFKMEDNLTDFKKKTKQRGDRERIHSRCVHRKF